MFLKGRPRVDSLSDRFLGQWSNGTVRFDPMLRLEPLDGAFGLGAAASIHRPRIVPEHMQVFLHFCHAFGARRAEGLTLHVEIAAVIT